MKSVMRSKKTGLIVLGVAAALLLGISTAAQAQVGRSPEPSVAHLPDIGRVKARAIQAIERRLETVDRIEEAIDDNPHLEAGHAGRLRGQLHAARAGLSHLAGRIERASSLVELRELIPKIVEDYRIYVLVAPKVRLVIGADTVGGAVDRFEEVESKLAERISEVAAAGGEVDEAEALLDSMSASVDEAAALAGGVSGLLVPLEVSDWPVPARVLLDESRTDLLSARDALKEARALAHQVVKALRDAMSAVAP